MENQNAKKLERITLGGGCFWCIEAVFLDVQGVINVESGYSNGLTEHPTYEAVCSGETGYAEVVRVEFDPQVIDLKTILGIFFTIHDPTSLNRQGNDEGTQYRSAIYTQSEEQLKAVQSIVSDLKNSGAYDKPIVTEIAPETNYVAAEAYHQRYFENHPNQGYCAFVVRPKVEKFRHVFPHLQAQS